MRWVRGVIVFLTLFGIMILVLNIQFVRKRQVVFKCQPHDVHSVKIWNQTEEFVISDLKAKEGWQISSRDYKGPIQSSIADTFIIALCTLTYQEKFVFDPQVSGLENYGLKSPVARIVFSAGEKDVEWQVGGEAPSGTEFYLASSHAPGVIYTLSNSYKKVLLSLAEPFNLRLRTPFFDLSSEGIDMEYQDLSFKIREQNAVWTDLESNLTQASAQEIIQSLKKLSYSNFHGPLQSRDETHKFGFFAPDIHVKWKLREYEITFFNNRYYLLFQEGEKSYVLILDSENIKSIYDTLNAILIEGFKN